MTPYEQGQYDILVKLGFSVTEKGHAYDADVAKARKELDLRLWQLAQEAGGAGYHTPKGIHSGGILDALRFNGPVAYADPRHHGYVEKKHQEGKNAYNPFGGVLTPLPEEQHGTRWFMGKVKDKKSKD